MDIDHLAAVLLTHFGRQDLHVAGQHDDVRAVGLEQAVNLGKGLRLVLLADRDTVVGDFVPLHHPAQVFMVRDNGGDVHIQLATVPAVQQIGHAVGFLAAHEHHFLGLGRVGNVPAHLEFPGDGLERGTELVQAERDRAGLDFVPHEEPAGLVVGVMAGFSDPAIVGGQEVTDFCHNTHPVRAGNHQTVCVFHEPVLSES